MRRLPGPAGHRLGDGGDSRGSLRVVSGLAENTNSIFCDSSSELEAANGCPVLLESRNHQPRGTRALPIPVKTTTRSPARVKKTRAFPLTKTYMDGGHPTGTLGSADTAMRMPFPSSATKTSTKCWRQPPLDCLSDVGSPWPEMNTPFSLARGTLRNHGIALLDGPPGLVGVVLRHGRRHFCRVRSKVLLKQLSILVDDKGHHTGGAVRRGVGKKRDAAG